MDNDNNDRIGLRVTAYSAMGARRYNEDFYSVAYSQKDGGKDLDYAYFGMFDGHGGYSASLFAKNHLMNLIVNEPGFWSSNDQEVLQSIKKGFLECHLSMWKDLDKWPPTSSGLPSTAGTTASVAFIRKGKLYIGHCGDSGIVLGRTNPEGGRWSSQPLTVEHKPESPAELKRIESFGGKVQQKQGIHRVVWYRPKNPHHGPIRRNTKIEEIPFLAVARSLGDLWSYNYKTEKFVVSPEPDVYVIDIEISSFKCLVFASDGLWNVIDPDYSVESVFETERLNDHNAKLGNSAWRNPSRVLVEAALEKWRSNNLRADNTTVVCVMLDPPNKRNMFKFSRSQHPDCATPVDPRENAHTIFDYSTSEAYNLDFASAYGNEGAARQNAVYEMLGENQNSNYYNTERHYQYSESHQNYSGGYNSFETSYGYQVASTSQPQNYMQQHAPPPPLTYQTSSNESAFVKACCRNNYLLANANEQIPYHSTYEQHREMYENMTLKPYPPLHYAYRPVPTPQVPLPSLHTNLYDHQGYLQNTHHHKPMERYNYLRPTPEEVAALHNEEDEDSGSDTDAMEFSDEESDEGENENESQEQNKSETANSRAGSKMKEAGKVSETSRDDSIQIFEISSSSFHDTNSSSSDHKKKPAQSNNKENTEGSLRKKKKEPASRLYLTRQTDRKMRSANVRNKNIGREKIQRRTTRNIRKAVKTLIDLKPSALKKFETIPEATPVPKSSTRTNETKPAEKEAHKVGLRSRALRSAPTKEADSTSKKLSNEEVSTVRSLRSNSSNSNVMQKAATRKRTTAVFDSVEKSRERRIK